MVEHCAARDFCQKWNFPRCCGAIDGKHITIKQPPGAGTMFYNFKGFHSIVLFTMVDAEYNFTYINVGANGSASDSTIFQETPLFKSLENNTLGIPEKYVIVRDSIFPLKEYLMKPYGSRKRNPKKIVFNYRLSRATRIVENPFGILTWRFHVFTRPVELKLTTVDQVVLATCYLHNWLRSHCADYLT